MEKLNIELGISVFESRGLNGRLTQVEQIKETAAALWSMINAISCDPDNTEAPRLLALAKTDLESSVMWAVKGISRL